MEVSEDVNGSMVDSQEPTFDLDQARQKDNYSVESSGPCISKSDENIVPKQFLDASLSPTVSNCVVGEQKDDISVKFRLVSDSDGHSFTESLENKFVESDERDSVISDTRTTFESEACKSFVKKEFNIVQSEKNSSVNDCLESNREHSFVVREASSSSEITSETKTLPVVDSEPLSPNIVSTTAKGNNLFLTDNQNIESNEKFSECEPVCNSLKEDSNSILAISTAKDSEVTPESSGKDNSQCEQIDVRSIDNNLESTSFNTSKGSKDNFSSSPERNDSFPTDVKVNEQLFKCNENAPYAPEQFQGTVHLSEEDSSDSNFSDSEKSELFMKTSNDSTPVPFESQTDTDVSTSIDSSVGFEGRPPETKEDQSPFSTSFPTVLNNLSCATVGYQSPSDVDHQCLTTLDHKPPDSLDHPSHPVEDHKCTNALDQASPTELDHPSADVLDHPSTQIEHKSSDVLDHQSPAAGALQSPDALDEQSPTEIGHQSEDLSTELERHPDASDHQSPTLMDHQSVALVYSPAAEIDHQSHIALEHTPSADLDLPSPPDLGNLSPDNTQPSSVAAENLPSPDTVENLPSPDTVENLPSPDTVENLPSPDDTENQPYPDSFDHHSPATFDPQCVLSKHESLHEQQSHSKNENSNFGQQSYTVQEASSLEKGNYSNLTSHSPDLPDIDQSKESENSKLKMACLNLSESSDFDASKMPDVPSSLSLCNSLDHLQNSKNVFPSHSHTITYTGYKTPRSKGLGALKKLHSQLNSMGNPFNSSWKKGQVAKTFSVSDSCVTDDQILGTDPGTSLPEYTQYLGLQPTVNFKCNHCGTSGYESIQMLNVHQTECRKSLKPSSTSTNIKFTRKVYLCSVCGTYYNSCYLFIHMRERHEKFICLHCLTMFQNSDKLREHLTLKHQVNLISFSDLETFKKCNIPTYFLLCLDCDSGLSEKDDFKHMCDRTSDSFSQSVCTSVVVNPLENTRQSVEPVATTSESPQKKDKDDSVDLNLSDLCKKCNEQTDEVDDSSSQLFIRDPQGVPNFDSARLSEVPIVEDDAAEVEATPDPQESDPDRPVEPENACGTVSEAQTPREEVATGPNVSTVTPVDCNIKSPKSKGTKRGRGKNAGRQQSKKKKRSLKQIVCESSEMLVTKSEEGVVLKNDLPTENISPKRDFIPEDFSVNSSESKVETNVEAPEQKPLLWKPGLDKNILKFNLQADVDSDDESDDSNKLSMVIDETPATSDNDSKSLKHINKGFTNNSSDDSNLNNENESKLKIALEEPIVKIKDDVPLAGEDVPTMALTLDNRVEEVKVQLILKECVRTSCLSCNYCRRAVKIAVNGKQLALHLLSEHRYTPVKNDSPNDVIIKLKSSLEELDTMYFNTESYDSSDPTIFIPYDQDNTFDCFQCNYVTSSHKDLYMHKRKSHTKSLLLCIMCKSNFYSYSELLCHLCPGHYNPDESMINVDINYRCCFCRLDTIPSAFRLMVHLRKCHHTCDICLEICPDQQKLSTHMWKHKLNHLCYRCGIAYASKPDITKHLFWKHGTESVLCKKCLQKKWPHVYHFCIPPTSFNCEECNSSFSKAVALKVHKRIHSGDFSYTCSLCEKKFISKKLLSRHEDRHNLKHVKKETVDGEQDDNKPKEEIIDVTGVENPDASSGSISADPKESDKESDNNKHHKKHRKDKKSKPVIDVYDLPPLNLSSDSDSSDEENQKKAANSDSKAEAPGLDDTTGKVDDNMPDSVVKTENASVNENADKDGSVPSQCMEIDNTSEKLTKEQPETFQETSDGSKDSKNEIFPSDLSSSKGINSEQAASDTAENIWENFYKTNSQNKNLPYPLCAMKTEVAYGIIMGDHDYCQQVKYDPVINEDIPTSSNLDNNLNDMKSDNLDLDSNSKLDSLNVSSDISPKKKQKSPKKKVNKNNSSSSSDSSSDSDSSSCSCGTKCSCSSSSSDSSSSSSSDSDSSASDGKQKSDKRKKKKERKIKNKVENSTEPNKEVKVDTEPDIPPPIPEDPAIRESELETDETTTDEEFYDRQPQKVVNQLLAEKRNQLMLLASVAPVNNGNISPIPGPDPPQIVNQSPTPVNNNEVIPVTTPTSDLTPSTKRKVTKTRRKRNLMTKGRQKPNPKLPLNSPSQTADHTPTVYKPSVKQKEHKYEKSASRFLNRNFPPESSMGSGSESENLRASKRRRIPNKFYGYSSGEEEEKLSLAPIKWRKQEAPTPPPPVSLPPAPLIQKIIHTTPQTPRIQLSVPKQIIRKSQAVPKYKSYSSSNDSSDSGSEEDIMKFSDRPKMDPVPEVPKADKNVYCYCRCPYDEVSEMIACDDANCKIEWFHFECVGILVPPKGQWFCPECKKKRGL